MTITSEFELLFRYLNGNQMNKVLLDSYIRGVDKMKLSLTETEKQMLRWCFKYPNMIGIVDCGLALNNPSSNLRKRFALMAAIIECQPSGVKLYLNTTALKMPLTRTFFLALIAALKILVAKFLFFIKRWS